MERSLAHIEKVFNIRPIEGADRIEQINVLGWNLIVKKGEFQEGDKCVYIEIDSIVDETNEDFAFLESKKYKIKSMKMRGVVSQGLALPVSILPEGKYNIGDDVTDILKIKKIQDDYIMPDNDVKRIESTYKKLMKNKFIKYLMKYKFFRNLFIKLLPKKKKGRFPAWVSKTDEPRIQNMPWILQTKTPFQVCEKLDGTSATYTLKKISRKKFDFTICSRNIVVGGSNDVKNPKLFYGDNYYVEMAVKYDIENVLKSMIGQYDHITLQGEIIGEGIQKNKYGLTGRNFYAFNLITPNGKINSVEAKSMLKMFSKIKWVPIILENYILPDTIDELMQFSTGQSALSDTLREGYVFRDKDNQYSFKVVSNEFLLKWGL